MELTYADYNGIELGRILDYEMDVAIGKDENTFSVTIPLADHCCLAHYRIYVDGTELGGIVDSIKPDTDEDTVTYSGRTWHGIIDNKIIKPRWNSDYFIVNGEANAVLLELVGWLDLTDICTVSTEISTVTIKNYQFARYEKGFLGICKMLYANDGKLKINYANKICTLSVVPSYDYSDSEELSSNQVDFAVERNYSPINHLICLGKGDLSDRKVIHLFTDENGGVQQYAYSDTPYRDLEYIMGEQSKRLFRQDEIAEVLDMPNAETVYNYVLLTTQPNDWGKYWLSTSFTMYYSYSGSSYTQLELDYTDVYTLLTSQPSDWMSNYASYYKYSNSRYSSVDGVSYDSYSILRGQPSDWNTNYGDYFYKYNDGTTITFKSVTGISQTKYKIQTSKPSDWVANYSSYYTKDKVTKYVYKVKTKIESKWVVTYEEYDTQIDNVKTDILVKTYQNKTVKRYEYKTISLTSAPVWKTKKYYTASTNNIAPAFVDSYYYSNNPLTAAPTWETGKYYVQSTKPVIPTFVPYTYYQKFEDNYASLVEKGLEKLRESYDCDTIDIELDTDQEFDINDIISATEQITGISVSQPITKKIYKVKKDVASLSYEIGAWS